MIYQSTCFCELNRDKSRLNCKRKIVGFQGQYRWQIYKRTNGTLDCQTTVLKIATTTTRTKKNVLTHAHMLTPGMCTAGVEKKLYPSACVCVCACP